MGNACFHPTFTSLNFNSSNDQLLAQLRERPELLCTPKPAAILGLNDSALHMAAEHKLLDVAHQIFTFLASADQQTLEAALRPYCRRKHLPLPASSPAAVKLAANMANNKGQTPLMYACYRNCPDMIKILLEQGADPWQGDNCGCRNALHYAAISGSVSCVEALMKHILPHMLVRHGVRYINSCSLSGLTPLHYCVFFGHLDALEQLLVYEPNINAASTGESYDTYGSHDIYSTPLHFAAFQDSAQIAKKLLLHYARRRRLGTILDPRMRANSAGKLPWQVARSSALVVMLHPSARLEEVLGRDGEEALLGLGGGDQVALGPPALAALAGAALRQKLLAAVEVIERECVEAAALQRQQTGRTGGLLSCATPRRGSATATSSNCNPGARGLFKLASRGRGRHASGAVIPASPCRAPTLDRLPHPTDLPSPAANGFSEGVGGSYGQQLLQQRSRGLPSTGGTASGRNSNGGRGWPIRAPSGQVRGRPRQVQQTQGWDTSGFLGTGAGGGGGGGGSLFASWHPVLGLPVAAAPTIGSELNLRSISLNAGPRQPFVAGDAADVVPEMRTTLPGGASPASPYLIRSPPDGAAGDVSPDGCSPIRCSDGFQPRGGSIAGSSDACVRQMVTAFGGTLLSPATSLVAGSCTEFDAAAAAAVRAATVEEECSIGGINGTVTGNDMGGSDDDDGTCNVCFARPEAVMSATCHHGLCTACAGELCRALVSKPLLCPFCRGPVRAFVRTVKQPVLVTVASGRR
ncbi:hypothetical protein Vafri_20476 [Volvox africanus]|uniref:RING-type domain-containing protein n=1 Tax=Volvox africanus TaxID=51714 RepID=A0A8J4BRE5_9CHLO|nr:hypothetical protein Vafri_20476 [Volvox africanus]